MRRFCTPLFEVAIQHGIDPELLQEIWSHGALRHSEAQGSYSTGHSRLNPDGLPVQLELIAGATGHDARLVLDPCWGCRTGDQSIQDGHGALGALAPHTTAQTLISGYERLLRGLLLIPTFDLDAHEEGWVWLTCDPAQREVGFTLDLTLLDRIDAWCLVQDWLEDHLTGEAMASRWTRELNTAGYRLDRVGHTCIDGTSLATLRAVQRSAGPTHIPALEGIQRDALELFLTDLNSLTSYYEHTTYLTLSIDPDTHTLARVQLEVEPTIEEGPQWWRRFEQTLATLDVPDFSVGPRLQRGELEVRGLALELTPSTTPAAIVRLKPRGLPRASVERTEQTRRHLQDRVERAVHALLDRQHPEGHWQDWRLPFGWADAFATALIGLTLSRAQAYHPNAMDAAQRAAQWLDIMRAPGAGWGLSAHTGPDARPTALVLRLFEATGHAIERADRAILEGMWKKEGGFCTCDGPLHWSDVHPCVTAMAWPALSKDARAKRTDGIHEYLARFATEDGSWPAYWWRTHHVSTYHHLLMLSELELLEEFPLSPEATLPSPDPTSFELAWSMGSALLAGESDERVFSMLEALLRRQQVDGSWQGGEDLRLTDPGCATPWAYPRGPLYRDLHGTITTASALWVMLDVLQRM